jgi:hypothetical protein
MFELDLQQLHVHLFQAQAEAVGTNLINFFMLQIDPQIICRTTS